jgi:hypothetical protein
LWASPYSTVLLSRASPRELHLSQCCQWPRGPEGKVQAPDDTTWLELSLPRCWHAVSKVLFLPELMAVGV